MHAEAVTHALTGKAREVTKSTELPTRKSNLLLCWHFPNIGSAQISELRGRGLLCLGLGSEGGWAFTPTCLVHWTLRFHGVTLANSIGTAEADKGIVFRNDASCACEDVPSLSSIEELKVCGAASFAGLVPWN
eukprot:1366938-Amphidinium_carterae.1